MDAPDKRMSTLQYLCIHVHVVVVFHYFLLLSELESLLINLPVVSTLIITHSLTHLCI